MLTCHTGIPQAKSDAHLFMVRIVESRPTIPKNLRCDDSTARQHGLLIAINCLSVIIEILLLCWCANVKTIPSRIDNEVNADFSAIFAPVRLRRSANIHPAQPFDFFILRRDYRWRWRFDILMNITMVLAHGHSPLSCNRPYTYRTATNRHCMDTDRQS
jgi:hypothetical protein